MLIERIRNKEKLMDFKFEENYNNEVFNIKFEVFSTFNYDQDLNIINEQVFTIKNNDKELLLSFTSGNNELSIKLMENLKNILNNKQITLKTRIEQISDIATKNKLINNINVTKRFNEKTYTQNNNNKNNTNGNKNYKNVDYVDIEKLSTIPIYKVIQILLSKDYISLVDKVIKNGKKEEFYKFVINDEKNRITEENVKVSVASSFFIENNPEDIDSRGIYSDVKSILGQGKKGGRGVINFIQDLEEIGAFGEPLQRSNSATEEEISNFNKKRFGKAIGIVKDLILNNTDIDLDDLSVDQSKSFHNYLDLKLTPRLPNKEIKNIKKFRDFLVNERKLDEDIVEEEIKAGRIYSGNYVNADNKFSNMLCFGQYDSNFSRYPNSVELCYLKKVVDENTGVEKEKLAKIFFPDKERKGLLYGKINKNPEITFFSEAVIDSISLECLLKRTDKIKNANFISAQGSGNLVTWLEHACGFGFIKNVKNNDENTVGQVYKFTKEEVVKDFSEKELLSLKKSVSDRIFYFVLDESEKIINRSNLNLIKLNEFLKFLDKTLDAKVIRVKSRGAYIDNRVLPENAYLIDNTNIDDFFKENNINFEYDSVEKMYTFNKKIILTKEELVDDSDTKTLKELKENFIRITKTPNVALSYDNDFGGLEYYEGFYKMCKRLNLNVSLLIPPFIGKINDNNDILKHFKEIEKKFGKEQSLKWLDEKYLSQLDKDIYLNGELKKAIETYFLLEKEKNPNKKKDNGLNP